MNGQPLGQPPCALSENIPYGTSVGSSSGGFRINRTFHRSLYSLDFLIRIVGRGVSGTEGSYRNGGRDRKLRPDMRGEHRTLLYHAVRWSWARETKVKITKIRYRLANRAK